MPLFHVAFIKETEYTIEAATKEEAKQACEKECKEYGTFLNYDSEWRVEFCSEVKSGKPDMGVFDGKLLEHSDYKNDIEDAAEKALVDGLEIGGGKP